MIWIDSRFECPLHYFSTLSWFFDIVSSTWNENRIQNKKKKSLDLAHWKDIISMDRSDASLYDHSRWQSDQISARSSILLYYLCHRSRRMSSQWRRKFEDPTRNDEYDRIGLRQKKDSKEMTKYEFEKYNSENIEVTVDAVVDNGKDGG